MKSHMWAAALVVLVSWALLAVPVTARSVQELIDEAVSPLPEDLRAEVGYLCPRNGPPGGECVLPIQVNRRRPSSSAQSIGARE